MGKPRAKTRRWEELAEVLSGLGKLVGAIAVLLATVLAVWKFQSDKAIPVPSSPVAPDEKTQIAPASPSDHPTATAENKSDSKPKTRSQVSVRGVIGCWDWYNGSLVKMRSDGSINVGAVDGHWRALGENSFQLVWSNLVDTIGLRAEGAVLGGTNNYGLQVMYLRKSGDARGIVGIWQSGNLTAEFRTTGEAILNGMPTGRWESTGDQSYRIVWTHYVRDDIKLDADSKLSGNTRVIFPNGPNNNTEWPALPFTATRRGNCVAE